MNIELVKLSREYKEQLDDMMSEWLSVEQNFSPYAIRKNDYRDFDFYLENLEVKEATDERVPDSTYFCLDKDRNIFVGAVNIRHYLNDNLCHTGGHIGDGIRPSERRKGYATAMIHLALEKCREMGMNKVLMTCGKDNIGSAKSIINNGGVDGNFSVCCQYRRTFYFKYSFERRQGLFKVFCIVKFSSSVGEIDR